MKISIKIYINFKNKLNCWLLSLCDKTETKTNQEKNDHNKQTKVLTRHGKSFANVPEKSL